MADRQSTESISGKAAQHGLAGSSQRDPGKKFGSFRVRDHLQPGGACRLGHDPGCGRFPVRSRSERAAAALVAAARVAAAASWPAAPLAVRGCTSVLKFPLFWGSTGDATAGAKR